MLVGNMYIVFSIFSKSFRVKIKNKVFILKIIEYNLHSYIGRYMKIISKLTYLNYRDF